jgi:hypothetical protein
MIEVRQQVGGPVVFIGGWAVVLLPFVMLYAKLSRGAGLVWCCWKRRVEVRL